LVADRAGYAGHGGLRVNDGARLPAACPVVEVRGAPAPSLETTIGKCSKELLESVHIPVKQGVLST
jgi:hypothetical protein